MFERFRVVLVVLCLCGLVMAGAPMAAAPRSQGAKAPVTLIMAAKQLLLRLKCSITSRLSPPLPTDPTAVDDPADPATLLPVTTT
jgi:hypothetical protein